MPTFPCGFTCYDEHLEDPRSPIRIIMKLHRKKCEECRLIIDQKEFNPRTTEQKKELKKITDTLDKHKKVKHTKDRYMTKVENKREFNESILSRDIEKVDKLALSVMKNYNKDKFTELAHILEDDMLKETVKERIVPLLEARDYIFGAKNSQVKIEPE